MQHTAMKSFWNAVGVLLLGLTTAQASSQNVGPRTNGPPIVDLGYARYQAYRDSKSGLDVFKGFVANNTNKLGDVGENFH